MCRYGTAECIVVSIVHVYSPISDHKTPAVTQLITPTNTVRPTIPPDPPTPPDPNAPTPSRPAADLLVVALGDAVPVGDAEVALSVLVLIPCTLQSVNGHEALVISDREE
ncbi:hypothetical protein EHS25_005810 [Saitozyma podzolica]|uniref:Uncharacterized protein n=1 Tax=Saitozyma podzolica TaxID=1890683 RepID=A0A427XVG6_9TREE|nr:hypothetical protein EHS25_005810 [Saitozyma podzolica]